MSDLARAKLSQRDQARCDRLSVLAKAAPARLVDLWTKWLSGAAEPAHILLRPAEIGTVMVRGRAGAKGASFNLGEMSVTRCTVRVGDTVGHGTMQGRDKNAARIVALIDALAEGGQAAALDAAILTPLRAASDQHRASRAAKANATKVQFFTMVRGDS